MKRNLGYHKDSGGLKFFSSFDVTIFVENTERYLKTIFGKRNVKIRKPEKSESGFSKNWRFEITNNIGIQRTIYMEFHQRYGQINKLKEGQFNEIKFSGGYDHEKFGTTRRRITSQNRERFNDVLVEITNSIKNDLLISSSNRKTSKFELECIKITKEVGFSFNPESGTIHGTIKKRNISVQSDEGDFIELEIDTMKMKDILPLLKAIKNVLT